jgi:flagellar biogenesis protein FliO
MHLTPHQKLIGAAVLAASIPLLAASQGASSAGVARALLAAVALGAAAAWYVKRRASTSSSGFKAAPRLKVIQRVGLSQRAGLVLVEVDGRPYLVTHGDGFARVRPVRRPALAPRHAQTPTTALPALEEAS